jgi:hypothetical protein
VPFICCLDLGKVGGVDQDAGTPSSITRFATSAFNLDLIASGGILKVKELRWRE